MTDATVAADLAIALMLVGAAAFALLRRDASLAVLATSLAIAAAWLQVGAPAVGAVELAVGLLAWRVLRSLPCPAPPPPSAGRWAVAAALGIGIVATAMATRADATASSLIALGAASIVIVGLHGAIVGADASGRIAALRTIVGACVLVLGALAGRASGSIDGSTQAVAAIALALTAIGTLQGASIVRRLHAAGAKRDLDEDSNPSTVGLAGAAPAVERST